MKVSTKWKLSRKTLGIRRVIVIISLLIGVIIYFLLEHPNSSEDYSVTVQIANGVITVLIFGLVAMLSITLGFHVITGIPIDDDDEDAINATWYRVTNNFRLSSYRIEADAKTCRRTLYLHLMISVSDLREIQRSMRICQWVLAKIEIFSQSTTVADLPIRGKRFYVSRFILRQIADDCKHFQESGETPQFVELRFDFSDEYYGKKDYTKMQNLIIRQDAEILRELITENDGRPVEINSAYIRSIISTEVLDRIEFDYFPKGWYLAIGEADVRTH